MDAYAMNRVSFAYTSVEEAWPEVEPGLGRPFGSTVLVQLRKPKATTKGGIILTSETRQTELWNVQVGKVLSYGPVAFRNRNTLEPWPEGSWAEVGDFVRVPKYGGDRWSVTDETGEEVVFVLFNDLDLRGTVNNPLDMKAFI